ncbi:cell division protein FtsQ/DivIB [Gandjariella thermophila]|uniref:Cell division protein FtsQ n=1 Tax=Gandjariella thermophila TaxID=1931992 RepID=A0A4D4J839_9PSEU|nr:FtsQ-type POTRA domain-containing protein [Gandjariella thermophila]GDY32811.1 cell division protein FtsQ [Gandjariella thermophila]
MTRPSRAGEAARTTRRTPRTGGYGSHPARARRTGRPVRRPSRQRILFRRWMVLLTALALVGLGYGVTFTPLLGVRHVDVVGTMGVTPDQVRAAAAIPPGSPMLRLDLRGIRDRVAALPRVAAVQVDRSWPATVSVRIVERSPVGLIRAEDGLHLVDRTGTDYATVADPPPGVPELRLRRADPHDRLTTAMVGVLAALPDRLRAEVLSVSAGSPGSVRLSLSGGREVRWGGVESSARKAAVLQALLTRDGQVYDVSSPELPTVS